MKSSILDNIEKIYNITSVCGIENYQLRGKRYYKYVTEKLGISPLQAVLFAHFMEKSTDSGITIGKIADSCKCSQIRMLSYVNELEELEEKKLIRCSRKDGNVSYRISLEVKNSLRKHDEYRPEEKENLSIDKFFTVLEKLFSERDNDELTFETLTSELLDLVNLNMELNFCKQITGYGLPRKDLVLLLCLCHLFANNDDDYITIHDISFLYEDKSMVKALKRDFSCEEHILFINKLVELNNNDGFRDTESWKLSDKAKKDLLPELVIKENRSFKKNIILFDTIKPKKLFYNPRETAAIAALISLLSDESYRKIQERLDNRGMRKGFACLFSGGPGTGKTETAYQIARETKRNIMMVDISETKSMWYGESQRRVKQIFNSYRAAVEKSSLAPILLFNEADAVISRRKDLTSTSRSVDQTENAIQNIILQEMENLSGILIATTNFTQNMDKAFERRFLYKIEFDRPGSESRFGIWNSMLPCLAEKETMELSSRFDLSGGQIENIARKIEVDTIINGGDPTMDTLIQYCKDEVQNSFSTFKKIGFAS